MSWQETRDTGTVPLASETHPAPLEPDSPSGRFILLEELGSGGMGTVYRAYDPRLHREIAIKRLHPHIVEKTGVARLLREARAMAQLSHPGVVEVYSVEVVEEQISLVMQYVPGTTLRVWQNRRPGARAVLEAYVAAGQGLAAAHALGIVHRDFKPANVLLDQEGRVKVTDFGLARLGTEAKTSLGSSRDMLSTVGSDDDLEVPDASLTRDPARLGTPSYMAPEQHDGQPATAASDQYAFCVSLWQALSGRKPFVGSRRAMVEAKRHGPPPFPAGTDVPSRVRKALRRGLAPDPASRWPSMKALLAELQTMSGGSTRWVPLGLGVGLVGALAAIALPEHLATHPCDQSEERLASVWNDERRNVLERAFSRSEAPAASSTWSRVQERIETYAETWTAQHGSFCRATHVEHRLSPWALDLRMTCLTRARGALEGTLEALETAEASVVSDAVDLVARLPPLDRCASAELVEGGSPTPDDPTERSKVAELRGRIAKIDALAAGDQLESARRELEAALADATGIDFAPLENELRVSRASLDLFAGDYASAAAAFADAYREAAAVSDVELVLEILLLQIQTVGVRQARQGEARVWAVNAATWIERYDPSGPRAAELQNVKGDLAILSGDYSGADEAFSRALELYEESLGLQEPRLVAALLHRGGARLNLGRYDEAREDLLGALELGERILGPEHHVVASVLNSLGGLASTEGRTEDARTWFERALHTATRALGPEHPMVAKASDNLGRVLVEMGEYDKAQELLLRSLELSRAAYGDTHPFVGTAWLALAQCDAAQENFERGLERADAGLLALESSVGRHHPGYGSALFTRAEVLAGMQAFDRASADLQEAESLFRTAFPTGHPALTTVLEARANLDERQHAWREAHDRRLEALASSERFFGPEHPETVAAHLGLARSARHLGLHDDERRHLQAAVTIADANVLPSTPQLSAARERLATF